MLGQILVAILIVAVAVMVGADLVRTKTEDPSVQPDGAGYDVRPTTIGGTRGARGGASYGTGIPAAGQDAGLSRHPGHADRSAADRQPPRTASPIGQGLPTQRDGVPSAHG